MTGAGSASVAWTSEQGYLGGPAGTPTYYEPGSNVEVDTAELSRNLLEVMYPDDPEAQEFVAQRAEGQLDVSFILTNDEFHRLLFQNNTSFVAQRPSSAEWYLGVDYYDGVTERQIRGWVCASCSITYNGTTEAVRVSMSGPYATEERNTAITPGTVSRSGDEVPGHGTTVSVNNTDVGRLQSATLSFDGVNRLIYDDTAEAIDAANGNVTESVDVNAIFDGDDLYQLALGGTSASTLQPEMDDVPLTLTFEAGGTTIADYSFSGSKPDTYGWDSLVDPDTDLEEAVALNATGVTGSDPTA